MTNNKISLNFNHILNVNKEIIQKIVKHIEQRIKLNPGEVSISFVPADEIQQLNYTYRSQNKPTDVLTFNICDDDILGDIYICIETVENNAREYSRSFQSELAQVIAHAFAHLNGYDHKDETEYNIIRDYEDFLLKGIKL